MALRFHPPRHSLIPSLPGCSGSRRTHAETAGTLRTRTASERGSGSVEPHGGELERVRVRERAAFPKKIFGGEMKPCSVCGRVGCRVVAHQFASNAASNAPIDAPTASNNASNADPAGKHQRWSRENYNAYQREYMKVYRAVKSGRAEFINRREK